MVFKRFVTGRFLQTLGSFWGLVLSYLLATVEMYRFLILYKYMDNTYFGAYGIQTIPILSGQAYLNRTCRVSDLLPGEWGP